MRNTLLPLTDLDFYCFSRSNNILSYSVSMTFQKDFHMISQIDYLIREIAESGLLFKWLKDSSRLVPNDNEIKENERVKENVKLTNEHFEGAYLLLFFGEGLALIVFIIENVFHELNVNEADDDVDQTHPFEFVN